MKTTSGESTDSVLASSPADLLLLILLAAIWGASFLFMRVAVPEFGPMALISMRVLSSCLCITAVLGLRFFFKSSQHRKKELQNFSVLNRQNVLDMVVLGVMGSAVPFSLLAFSAVYLSAGFTSILNASAPLFTALIAYFWIKERLSSAQVFGLCLGFCGVSVLFGKTWLLGSWYEVLAAATGLLASLSYGYAANLTKQRLGQLPHTTVCFFTQAAASVVMLPLGLFFWPERWPSISAWLMVIVLGAVCTSFAFLIFYRLIERMGPSRAISVTFLVPVFSVVWGYALLSEPLTWPMALGGGIILLGTYFTTGGSLRLEGKSPVASDVERGLTSTPPHQLR